MRIDLDLKTVDGRKNMKTGVDIDETQLKVPLEEVIGLTMRKMEEKVRKQLGLNPIVTKKEEKPIQSTIDSTSTPVPKSATAEPVVPPTPKPITKEEVVELVQQQMKAIESKKAANTSADKKVPEPTPAQEPTPAPAPKPTATPTATPKEEGK